MGKVAEVQAGEFLVMDVRSLKPTQFAVGMRQVRAEVKKIGRRSRLELKRLVQRKPIPAVIGPGNQLFIVDHHHLASALYEAGETRAWIEVLEDWSHLSKRTFWRRMEKNKWVHLYDCNGKARKSCGALPKSVASLGNDEYRSLAWAVRKRGGYFKSSKPFSDFEWANLFRERVKADPSRSFKKALKQALDLALSEDAQGLPGYVRFET